MSIDKKPPYLYENDEGAMWAKVTSDLLMSKAYTELSHAARAFYIVLVTHKQTRMQKECLYMALREYHTAKGDSFTEDDLQQEAGTSKRQRLTSTKFVIPQSHLLEYGYSPQYANKLKKELMAAGFIRVFANEKKHSAGLQGANRDFSKCVTIYEFSMRWKSKTS